MEEENMIRALSIGNFLHMSSDSCNVAMQDEAPKKMEITLPYLSLRPFKLLKKWLRRVHTILINQDRSKMLADMTTCLTEKYCWSVERVEESQLVALCVVLLFSHEYREEAKVAAQVLDKYVYYLLHVQRASYCITGGPSVFPPVNLNDKPTIDQDLIFHAKTYVDDLVVKAFDNSSSEVRRQLCCAFAFIASCYTLSSSISMPIAFGPCIKSALVRSFCLQESDTTCFELLAIAFIESIDLGMRELVFHSEMSDTCLVKFMSSKDELNMEYSRWIAAYIIGRKWDDKLWERVKCKLMPAILDYDWGWKRCVRLLTATACAISLATCFASSSAQMEDLVKMGCLRALFALPNDMDASLFNHCADGIQKILSSGDENFNWDDVVFEEYDEYDGGLWSCDDVKNHFNKYAKLADNYDPGWEVLKCDDYLFDDAVAARKGWLILDTYRPHKYPQFRYYPSVCKHRALILNMPELLPC